MSSCQYRKSHCEDKDSPKIVLSVISTMGFLILVRWHLYIESGPCCLLWNVITYPCPICNSSSKCFNSLAPGRFQFNFRYIIFKPTLVNGGWGISYEIALGWMPLDLTDDKSTLVQVMAWCRQATSHYLSQCWPRSILPNGVTRPQWVKDYSLVRPLIFSII